MTCPPKQASSAATNELLTGYSSGNTRRVVSHIQYKVKTLLRNSRNSWLSSLPKESLHLHHFGGVSEFGLVFFQTVRVDSDDDFALCYRVP